MLKYLLSYTYQVCQWALVCWLCMQLRPCSRPGASFSQKQDLRSVLSLNIFASYASFTEAAWTRGQTPVRRSFGIVFESPRGRGNIFSSPARAGPIGNIESLGPIGGRASVIAPLPERLTGLIEGSL